jgi:hypothetical protein
MTTATLEALQQIEEESKTAPEETDVIKPAKKAKGKKASKPAAKPAKAKAKAKAAKEPSANGHKPKHAGLKVGDVLKRSHKGKEVALKVVEDGYKIDGKTFTSLTAAARYATGYSSISGVAFWLAK